MDLLIIILAVIAIALILIWMFAPSLIRDTVTTLRAGFFRTITPATASVGENPVVRGLRGGLSGGGSMMSGRPKGRSIIDIDPFPRTSPKGTT